MTDRMLLPGSVPEVMARPAGSEVGAFFDLDGTLVAGFTAIALTQERLRRRDVGVGEFISMVLAGLNHRLGLAEFQELVTTATAAMRGRELSDLEEIGERVFVRSIESRIYPEMRELVRAHLARGHTVALTSSAFTIQVEPVARYLGITNVLCNRFETDEGGQLTGGVVKPIVWGAGKATTVQRFAAERGIDLARSYFYADGDEDVALMYLVGNPRPTNPSGRMEAVAHKRGWPVLRFASRNSSGLTGQLRSIAAVGSIVPAATGAIGMALLTRSRRRGVDFFLASWPRLLLTVGGVTVNVTGRRNLSASRPAVFIFNHRNNFDPFIAASLVGDRVTAVAKKELASDPIVGVIGRMIDLVFVDREDPDAAVMSIRQAEELAKSGLSILISPEGTRLDTTTVGPFKKGPFRLAMAARIPIVPIIIRNAETVAARNSNSMNPGTVDVLVCPPVSVQNWTLRTLPSRIEQMRQLYIDVLRDWPASGLPDSKLYPKKRAR